MRNLIFLCSGGGGNLRFVHTLWEQGSLNSIQSISVIADRECRATDWSRRKGLKTEVLAVTSDNQHLLVRTCKSHSPSLIISNFHKILAPNFVSEFSGKLINLHYSILPAFAGLIGEKTVIAALDYGQKIIGATTHLVTEVVDGGPPLAQVAFGVSHEDARAKVMDAMFRAGCISLFNALQVMPGNPGAPPDRSPTPPPNVTQQCGLLMLANPCYELPESLLKDEFWDRVRE